MAPLPSRQDHHIYHYINLIVALRLPKIKIAVLQTKSSNIILPPTSLEHQPDVLAVRRWLGPIGMPGCHWRFVHHGRAEELKIVSFLSDSSIVRRSPPASLRAESLSCEGRSTLGVSRLRLIKQSPFHVQVRLNIQDPCRGSELIICRAESLELLQLRKSGLVQTSALVKNTIYIPRPSRCFHEALIWKSDIGLSCSIINPSSQKFGKGSAVKQLIGHDLIRGF